MPTSTQILEGLQAISVGAAPVAVFWHVIVVAAILAIALGWRPRSRIVAATLVLSLISAAIAAFVYGLPFNGIVLGALSIALLEAAARSPMTPVERAGAPELAAGAAMMAFGAAYPHFVAPAAILYAAPLGLIPCPTLAFVVGATLALRGLAPRRWSLALASAGLFYGLVGVLWLGVTIDAVLLAGSSWLLANAMRSSRAAAQPMRSA